jgi:hypothetical protein
MFNGFYSAWFTILERSRNTRKHRNEKGLYFAVDGGKKLITTKAIDCFVFCAGLESKGRNEAENTVFLRPRYQIKEKIMSKSNTRGNVFNNSSERQATLSSRIGVCSSCKHSSSLHNSEEYTAEWDRHWAIYYFCRNCNPSPDSKLNFYTGQLEGEDNETIIDQVEF